MKTQILNKSRQPDLFLNFWFQTEDASRHMLSQVTEVYQATGLDFYFKVL